MQQASKTTIAYKWYLELLDKLGVTPGRNRGDLGIECLRAHLEANLDTFEPTATNEGHLKLAPDTVLVIKINHRVYILRNPFSSNIIQFGNQGQMGQGGAKGS